jgi:endogenous inhibitor of DNA gyrase (YacG/DUF329 family)
MTNANKKPAPLFPSVARAPCPVCGQPSYSQEGIHPQCAMHVADQIHIDRLRAGQFAQPAPDAGQNAKPNRHDREYESDPEDRNSD